jgi:tetratricopeptide (TPR) repeat protein
MRVIIQAAALAEAGRAEQAAALVEPLTRRAAVNPQASHLLGSLYSQLGRFDDAREQFERTLSVWPQSGQSWLGIAAIHRYKDKDPELERLVARWEDMEKAAPEARTPYLFALGKALDDTGAADDAFTVFAQGAELARSTRLYDRDGDRRLAEDLISGWTAEALSELRAEVDIDTSRPIFVTGIPRSGTTLVEQILVSHPDVGDGAEVGLFQHVGRVTGGARIEAARAYAAGAPSPAAAWRGAAELYLHLLGQRLPAPGRVVDKSLTSSRWLGLISLVLPQAPLVWVRRQPLDVAWSCFRTMFARGVDWSWSLEDIAHHIRLEDRLLDHWAQVLGKRLLVIDYEQLVAEPEGEGKRLFAHCGLADHKVEGFERTQRAVGTSSLAQVRQPVYPSSVGGAERYRKHLEPFVTAYGTGS